MRTRGQNFVIILILGALTTISPFSIDMYLPAFQKIADHFHTQPARVALSLSSYFVGLALGQIFYGPLLDRFGRKRPLYFGLFAYVIASLGCMLTSSIEGLIAARLFQALGGCAASVAATAMVRDFFTPGEGAKVFSRLMLILSVSPLFAPTVGGWIVGTWGWQAIFVTLATIVAVILVVVRFWLPEGHVPDATVSLRMRPIIGTFAHIFRDRTFFTFAVSGAFSFAGLFTYLAGAPSIFFGTFHLTENQFGLVFAALSVGMIGGGQVNIWLMKHFTSERVFVGALVTQSVMAILFAVGCAFEIYGLVAHLIIFFIYISCVGLTYPNAAALSLSHFDKNSGSASALLGTVQMGVGALASAAFGLLTLSPSMAVAVLFLSTSLIGLAILRIAHPPENSISQKKEAGLPEESRLLH